MRCAVSAGASSPATAAASATAATEIAVSARDRVVEDRPRRHVHKGHVRRREGEVHERRQLQPCVAQAPRKRAEEQRLCGPGDGQARPGQEVRGGHGGEGQRGDAEDEREIGLVEAAQHRPRGRPDRGCDGEREAEVGWSA